jgi:hypothetical protein
MKSKSYIVWVVGALLVIASVDTIPDPPAVNPHAVSVATRLCKTRGGACEYRLRCDWSYSSHLQVRWTAFTSVYEPNLPSDRIALTGFAADPSPPGARNSAQLLTHS